MKNQQSEQLSQIEIPQKIERNLMLDLLVKEKTRVVLFVISSTTQPAANDKKYI